MNQPQNQNKAADGQSRAGETEANLTDVLGMGATMELRNCVSGEAKFVARWHQICDEQDADQRKWVDRLRATGFKAAHPNDGWVNRQDNEVHFAYPHFNAGAAIGDLVMLGWPWDKKSWRPVRLIGMRVTSLGKMVWWQFQTCLT